MALNERVQPSPNGFKLWQAEGAERKAYYGIFALKDDPNEVPELKEALYWDLKNAFENQVGQKDTFVYIEEREGGKVVETYRFYYGQKKAGISWSMEKKKKYGKSAYMITLHWNNQGEAIHRAYIFMLDRHGNRYPFITKTLGGPGVTEDQYISMLPEGESPDGYKIGFHPLLMQKYHVQQE